MNQGGLKKTFAVIQEQYLDGVAEIPRIDHEVALLVLPRFQYALPNSFPRSGVMKNKSCFLRHLVILSLTREVVFFSAFMHRRNRLFRFASVTRQEPLFCPATVSPSQSPIRDRQSALAGRSERLLLGTVFPHFSV